MEIFQQIKKIIKENFSLRGYISQSHLHQYTVPHTTTAQTICEQIIDKMSSLSLSQETTRRQGHLRVIL